MKFSNAVAQYLDNLALEDGRNIPIKTRQLRQEITPFFAEYELAAINRFGVERFKRHLREKYLAPATVNPLSGGAFASVP
ncbi:MAG: hypothetical protein IPK79_07990 [Vampirovibrionales bacterium]|nr:hypothetical protein [Vampirovibrionales bacterium]